MISPDNITPQIWLVVNVRTRCEFDAQMRFLIKDDAMNAAARMNRSALYWGTDLYVVAPAYGKLDEVQWVENEAGEPMIFITES